MKSNVIKSLSYINEKIKQLRVLAQNNGLQIRFRNYPTMAGDFCIFIYDKSARSTYMVGFDGVNSLDYGSTFDDCVAQAEYWISNRDSRYKMENGEWKYLYN